MIQFVKVLSDNTCISTNRAGELGEELGGENLMEQHSHYQVHIEQAEDKMLLEVKTVFPLPV